MPDRLQFGSEAWLDALARIMQDAAASASPDELPVGYSMCEVFRGVPPDVNERERVAWHCRVTDDGFAWSRGEVDDVQRKIVGDWSALLPVARTVVGADPEAAGRVQRAMAEAVRAGAVELRGTWGPQPAALARVHDDIAARTA